MRLTTRIVVLSLVLLVACTSVPETRPSVPAAPPIPEGSATTTTTSIPTTRVTVTEVESIAVPRSFLTIGALPDGTPFQVYVEGGFGGPVLAVSAGIVIDVGGSRTLVATVEDSTLLGQNYYSDGIYEPAGTGARITFSDEILEEFGDDAERIIKNSITGTVVSGHPVLALGSPFDWATDEEMSAMEVRYGDFAVRRGCSPHAVACSDDGAVQVVPTGTSLASIPAWLHPEVVIESEPVQP